MPSKGKSKAVQKRHENLRTMHEQNRVLSSLELKIASNKELIKVAERQVFQTDGEFKMISQKLSEKKTNID